jgi:hypothetical protein
MGMSFCHTQSEGKIMSETHICNTNGSFSSLFSFPVGITSWNRWGSQNPQTLESIAQRMEDNPGVNPWVFSADARHFWQFCSDMDREFLLALTPEEHIALLGVWDDEDWELG